MGKITYYIAETEKGYVHRMIYGIYTDSLDDAHKVYDSVETAKGTFDRRTQGDSYKLLIVEERTERIIKEVE